MVLTLTLLSWGAVTTIVVAVCRVSSTADARPADSRLAVAEEPQPSRPLARAGADLAASKT
jgi:hypothetical protein